MDDRIKALAAQKRRIEGKQAALLMQVRTLHTDLNSAFGGTTIEGSSDNVNLEQYGLDEYTYGYLAYRAGELIVGYRTTDDDMADQHHGVPEEARGYSLRPLANCTLAWLERLVNEKTFASLFRNIGEQLDAREGRLDGSLAALQAIVAGESAKLDQQMDSSLLQMGDDSLTTNWREALDATHLDPADGLTRSSRFLESVCATILRQRGRELPRDKSLMPLLDACVACLAWPDSDALDDAKRFFGGVKSICGGVGVLRTHRGTAHGASSHLPPPDASYATLAKNAAAAVAIFLLSRHTEGTEPPNAAAMGGGTP